MIYFGLNGRITAFLEAGNFCSRVNFYFLKWGQKKMGNFQQHENMAGKRERKKDSPHSDIQDVARYFN